MDGKHFSLITIAMIILLGIVGLGFMQMQTNTTLSTISSRLSTIESQANKAPVKMPSDETKKVDVSDMKTFAWDFKLSYPDTYTVTKGETEMAPTTTILKISDNKGAQIEFTKRLLGDPEDLKGYKATNNPIVYEKISTRTVGEDGFVNRDFLVRFSADSEYFANARFFEKDVKAEKDLFDIVISASR